MLLNAAHALSTFALSTVSICFPFQAPDAGKLVSLGEVLQQNDVKHKVWVEQPENLPTCIALKPYPKEEVQKYMKKFKLLS